MIACTSIDTGTVAVIGFFALAIVSVVGMLWWSAQE